MDQRRELRDIIVDCLDEDLVVTYLEDLGRGRLVMDPEKPDEPFLDAEGFLTIRFRDVADIDAVAKELERRITGLQVIEVIDPTRPEAPPEPIPGSARAQQEAGLIDELGTF